MVKRLGILTLLFGISLVFSCSEESSSGKETVNKWLSFNEGMQLARQENKPVIIDFYTGWCKWCKVMDKETFANPQVANYLRKNFISIRINAEDRSESLKYRGKKYSPYELTRFFRVQGFPTLAYLDSEGEKIMLIAGFKKPASFLPSLKYVSSGCYKKDVSLAQFVSNGEKCD
ncbi:MAG: DUF255 domain-containing protein [Candidatus Krumholzibacteriota bacterium]|nr:DUF255 domain-containing protein [Candidatus Krumholzibacteriota bacterium]